MSHAAQANFEIWAPEECPLTVEYSTETIKEIRRMGARRTGVQGVLYGRLDGQVLRIVRARAVPEGSDERAWSKFARSAPTGLLAAGMFAIRETLSLSKDDLDRLRRHFAAPWQIALLLTRDGKAGFFARKHDGNLDPERSPSEFAVSEDESIPQMAPPRWTSGFGGGMWAASGLLALAAGYGSAKILPDKPLVISIEEHGDEFAIVWNKASASEPKSGTLEIIDAQERLSRSLTAGDFAAGRVTYQRRSGDVKIRLRVGDREKVTRYITRPPRLTVAQEAALLEKRIAELRSQNSASAAEIQRLDKTLALLQAGKRMRAPGPSGQP